jgi:hypothetical protein
MMAGETSGNSTKRPAASPKNDILLYSFTLQRPPGLNVRVGQHALHLGQNGRRKDQHMRPRYDGQKKIACKPVRRNLGVSANKNIGI